MVKDKFMIKKSINAFSIAEVLVTMLVVSLVVVLSMPVITRKNSMPMPELRADTGNASSIQTGSMSALTAQVLIGACLRVLKAA